MAPGCRDLIFRIPWQGGWRGERVSDPVDPPLSFFRKNGVGEVSANIGGGGVSARRRGGAAPERGHKKPRFRGIVSSVRCHLSLI